LSYIWEENNFKIQLINDAQGIRKYMKKKWIEKANRTP
jgi:hypothetical protein